MDPTKPVHKDFRLFACMNPATDVGKKSLPENVRSRFCEFYVSESTESEELTIIIKNYLSEIDNTTLQQILNFYTKICQLLPRKYRYFFRVSK